jgi:hypothetical protein
MLETAKLIKKIKTTKYFQEKTYVCLRHFIIFQ